MAYASGNYPPDYKLPFSTNKNNVVNKENVVSNTIKLKAKHCDDREYRDLEHLARERIESNAQNNSAVIGRLLDVLHGDGVITLQDVRHILYYGECCTLEIIE